jgi:hypothetical protein
MSRTVPFSPRRVAAPLFQVAHRLRPCLMQTVGHSSPVLYYLLTTNYSLLTSFLENPNPRPALKNRGRGTLRITESPGHPSLIDDWTTML